MTDVEPVAVQPTQPRIVVAALPLSKKARTELSDRLGDGYRVVDIRESVVAADLVICPACSPQAISALKEAFPTAKLMVAELEDWDHRIELGGPVTRSRDAGADAYVAASSLGALADIVLAAQEVDDAGPADDVAVIRELQSASVDDLILQEVAAALARRTRHARHDR